MTVLLLGEGYRQQATEARADHVVAATETCGDCRSSAAGQGLVAVITTSEVACTWGVSISALPPAREDESRSAARADGVAPVRLGGGWRRCRDRAWVDRWAAAERRHVRGTACEAEVASQQAYSTPAPAYTEL